MLARYLVGRGVGPGQVLRFLAAVHELADVFVLPNGCQRVKGKESNDTALYRTAIVKVVAFP